MSVFWIWVALGALATPPCGVSLYRHGFSDGSVRPGNLRATIAFAPLFGLAWPLWLVLAAFAVFFTWIDGGNHG